MAGVADGAGDPVTHQQRNLQTVFRQRQLADVSRYRGTLALAKVADGRTQALLNL